MRAVVYDAYGDPGILRVAELPDPKIAQHGVVVRTRAAGVNPADLALRAGYADPIMDAWFPVVPGWDVAGVVERVGAGVEDIAPGDEVLGYVRADILHHGAAAELVAADAAAFVPKPTRLTWEQAGALPLAGLTALQALDALGVGSDQTVLVHGAAGGVGSLAAQIARGRHARVVGTASPSNHPHLRDLGVEPVDYDCDDLANRIRELVPDGVDAVLDTVGRGSLDTTTAVGAPGVRAVTIAGEHPAARSVFARFDRADLLTLTELAEAGQLTVRVARTYPFERAAEAHHAVAGGHSGGKIVLVP